MLKTQKYLVVPILMHNLPGKSRSFLCDSGPFFGRSGIILGSLRDHFGIALASSLGRFGVSAFLGHLHGHFAIFW